MIMSNNIKLKALGLPGYITDKLANQNITTVQDFMELNYIELQRKTGFTFQKLSSVTEIIHNFVSPSPVQVSCLDQPSHVSFNDKLDIFLRGGVQCGHITEFSGAPGLGKTQLCFQLALANALQGKVNGVLYIDSEGAFSASRLLKIATHKYGLHDKEEIKNIFSRIHVWRPENLKEIMDNMASMEVMIISERIGLIIIDSMGSIIRRQFGAEKSVQRGALMCSLSSSLKRTAHEYNVAVVVTNHVTAKIKPDGQGTSNETNSSIPALGPSWSHWINSRLHLSHHENNERQIVIAKSAEIPELRINYCVSYKGVDIIDTCK